MSESKFKKYNIGEAIGLNAHLIIMAILFPLGLIYGFGLQSKVNLQAFWTFNIIGIAGALFVSIIIIARALDYFEKNPRWAGLQYITYHSTEATALGKITRESSFLPDLTKFSNMFIVGGLLFSIIGLFVGISGVLVPQIPSFVSGSITQITNNLAKAFFNVEPVVTNETILFQLVTQGMFIAIGFRVLYGRFDFDYDSAVVWSKIVSVILAILTGMIYHLTNYSIAVEEQKLVGVFFLWSILSILYAVSNSFILPYLFHWTGNLFDALSRNGAFNNEQIFSVAAVLFITNILIALALGKHHNFFGNVFGGEG